MIIINRAFLVLFALFLLFACTTQHELIVDCSNSKIAYSGRLDSSQGNGVDLYWPGSSIKINFEGESISALLRDDTGDSYYNVIVDNDSLYIIRPDTTNRYHKLAENLSKGKHTIEIFKRTEWDRGTTTFYGFQIEGNPKLLERPGYKSRKMEFYGNSITAAYAVEDTSGSDSPDSTYTNNYISYAAITARHFNAEYNCICRSGIGITVSWFPLIMPELYDRINPSDPKSKWDFSSGSPDIVVVNLLQNDSWLVHLPDFEEYKNRFGNEVPDDEYIINAYQEFVTKLRFHYPNAKIICSLGCMDAAKEGSEWIAYIRTAIANLNDKSIYTHIMPYIEATAHPSIQDHVQMSKSLIGFIEENIDW